jgi:hypothetical protein
LQHGITHPETRPEFDVEGNRESFWFGKMTPRHKGLKTFFEKLWQERNTMTANAFHIRWLYRFCFSISLAALFLPSGILHAELFTSLATDSNALSDYRGSLNMDGDNTAHTKYLHLKVEYAVYAPGTSFDASFPGLDPSNGTQFVYAYQIFNTGISTDEKIMSLTVGLDKAALPANISETANPTPLGVSSYSKSLSGTPPTSAVWSYLVAPMGSGYIVPGTGGTSRSKILFFTSPNGPGLDHASAVGTNATGATGYYLPSPVPEPTTLIILAVVGILLLSRKIH